MLPLLRTLTTTYPKLQPSQPGQPGRKIHPLAHRLGNVLEILPGLTPPGHRKPY